MAVPGDLAAGLDVETAHAQVMAGNRDLLLGEIDLAEQLLLDVLVSRGARLLAIGRSPCRPGRSPANGGRGERERAGEERGENEVWVWSKSWGSILCEWVDRERVTPAPVARRMPALRA